MINDNRLEAIENLIASGLNEENVQNPPRVSKKFGIPRRDLDADLQTGLGAVTVRVFAVKVNSTCSQFSCLVGLNMKSKANFNRLLDVARETFKENIADIYELGRELSEAHALPLCLVYQDSGFIFQLKKLEVEGELPAEFINITEKKGGIVFSTLDLVCLGLGSKILLFISVLSHEEKTKCEDERCVG